MIALDTPATVAGLTGDAAIRANPRRAPITVDRPTDFAAFWATALDELDTIDADTLITRRADLSTPSVDVFDVRYTSVGGVRVAAWLTVPTATPASGGHPAILLIPGYISDPTVAKAWSLRGYAVLSVAPRGKLRAMDPVNPGYPGLLVHDIVDPGAATYRGFYLDTVRGFDILAGHDDVDATRIGVHGSSQGGGLGVVVAALRPDSVACLSAGAPYLCGILDSARLTLTYPYQEVREYLHEHPEQFALVERGFSYLDVLNLADRVTCPTQVYLGLRDDVCPPETGFALADALPVNVELHAYEGSGHDAGLPWIATEIDEFLDRHLRPAGTAAREADRAGSNA